jgi:hypothetical protein
MSVDNRINDLKAWRRSSRAAFSSATAKVRSKLSKDPLNVLLFLGSLVFFSLYWRVGIFVTDNWTIANTLVAVADGHLHLDRVVFGPNAYAPGVNRVGDQFYGRNYGQVFLAVPFYFALDALSHIADLHIAIAGAWSLLLLGFLNRLGAVIGKPRELTLLGNGLALLAFAVNTAVAISFEPRMRYLAALQLSTMIAAAFLAVVIYRLLAAIHDRRTGLFIAGVAILASPIAFWASIPKRHVLASLLALLVLYAYYVSRSTDSGVTALKTRSGAYASVGLWAWIHAPEALAMFAVLVPIDLATARSNEPRRVAVVASTFFVSLIPFFLTNWRISGNPVKPPRFLTRTPAEATASGGAEISGDAGSATPVLEAFFDLLLAQLSLILRPLMTLLDLFSGGLGVFINSPDRIFHTFVQSAPGSTRANATDLTILETTPILAVLIAIPILLVIRYRAGQVRWADFKASPVRQTDAFALVFVVDFTLLYMSRLPLHAMWTVRYLLPVIPSGLYLVGRVGPVRRTVAGATPTLIYSYTGLVLIGGQLLLVLLVGLEPTQGEVLQFHGLLGLAAAAVAAFWMLAVLFQWLEDHRVGAVVLSIPLAVGTLFVLLTGLEYFVSGHFALGMSEWLSNAIPMF